MRAGALLMVFVLALSACRSEAPSQSPVSTATFTPLPSDTAIPTANRSPSTAGAFISGTYRNLLKESLGKSDAEIQAKWLRRRQLFYGDDTNERVYYPVDDDMAYITDIGNDDVRTEGMSYGMMIAVQMDKKEEFDRLWKWTKTHLYHSDGPYKGYFAWHAKTDGTTLANNPASDGEEWFAMALWFAANRWGSGEGIFDYQTEAQAILDTMLHKSKDGSIATDMFDPKTKQIVFVPTLGSESSFSDPSYHLPAYYALWARWATHDNEFWADAAKASRAFWKTAAHPETGLMPDYADFDGAPHGSDGHQDFRFDAFDRLEHRSGLFMVRRRPLAG